MFEDIDEWAESLVVLIVVLTVIGSLLSLIFLSLSEQGGVEKCDGFRGLTQNCWKEGATTFLNKWQALVTFVVLAITFSELIFHYFLNYRKSSLEGFWDTKAWSLFFGLVVALPTTLAVSLFAQRPKETLEFISSLGIYVLIAGGILIFFAINYFIYIKKIR